MLVDLKIVGKRVVVVGGGDESYRKTRDFLEAGTSILVVSKFFSPKIEQLAQKGKINLLQTEVKNAADFMSSLDPKPDIIVAMTNDPELNVELIRCAKANCLIAYAPDNPKMSDFTLPAVAKVGDVRIGISTGGKSPLMASILRQRIENMITKEDLLQVKLQEYIRKKLKHKVQEQKARKKLLYSVLENSDIKKAVKEDKYREAQKLAIKVIEDQLQIAGNSHERNKT